MIIYLLIDISASMTGAKMASLNDAMENLVAELQNFDSATNPLSLMALVYSRDAKWLSEKPMPLSEFVWERPTPFGMTAMGMACSELSKKLCETPSIALLITDGYPTDDFEDGIKELISNPCSKNCSRFAISIGEDSDVESLRRFVDSPEKVFTVNDLDQLSDNLSSIMQQNLSHMVCQKYNTMNDEWD